MSQFSVPADDRNAAFRKWQFKETVELEHQKQQLKEERKRLEQERKEFEKEKQEFYVNKKVEDRRAEHEKQLFDMKWRVLEGELKKLAAEKEQIEIKETVMVVNYHIRTIEPRDNAAVESSSAIV